MDRLAIAIALKGEFFFFLKEGFGKGQKWCVPSAGLAQLADLPGVGCAGE